MRSGPWCHSGITAGTQHDTVRTAYPETLFARLGAIFECRTASPAPFVKSPRHLGVLEEWDAFPLFDKITSWSKGRRTKASSAVSQPERGGRDDKTANRWLTWFMNGCACGHSLRQMRTGDRDYELDYPLDALPCAVISMQAAAAP